LQGPSLGFPLSQPDPWKARDPLRGERNLPSNNSPRDFYNKKIIFISFFYFMNFSNISGNSSSFFFSIFLGGF
jgi:hypothetical protein